MAPGKARLTVIYSSLLSVFTNQLRVRWCIRKHAGYAAEDGWYIPLPVAVDPKEARLFVLRNLSWRVSRASDVLATAFLVWFIWFTLAARPAQLLGHIRDSHNSQTIKRSRAPSPASLYLSRPCPHPPTSSSRPQCLPFPFLPMKGQILKALVSTSSRHGAPTVATVMESIRKIAFSVELLYHHPCYLLNATHAIAIFSLYNHHLRHSYRAPQEVVAEGDRGVCGVYDRGSTSLYHINQVTCLSFEYYMIFFLLAPVFECRGDQLVEFGMVVWR
ncbi:hypothetical protein EDB86DRAFT_2968810 [Lactarius hatsudake]|nr:hypothetical protein EDB86DRAFT_2968810 [Lactarius hatsudake]